MSIFTKYFPSTTLFFKYSDKNPYVAFQGEEVKVPTSEELKGIDNLSLVGKQGYMVVVNNDETGLELTNIMDGGEF